MKTCEVQLTANDCAQLKKLYYLEESLIALLERLQADDIMNIDKERVHEYYFNTYVKNHIDYDEFKHYCTETYIPSDFNHAKSHWSADFSKGVLIFTEDD